MGGNINGSLTIEILKGGYVEVRSKRLTFSSGIVFDNGSLDQVISPQDRFTLRDTKRNLDTRLLGRKLVVTKK